MRPRLLVVLFGLSCLSLLAVLFMSGYPDTAFDGGIVPADIRFIAKPFTPQQLARKVREAIAESPRGEPLQ